MNDDEIESEHQEDEALTENELELQVFQYADYEYVIGLVDFEQLNSSDFAFTINHVLHVTFEEEINDFVIFESTIVDSSKVYNLSKHKVIAMFTPNESLQESYYNMIYDIRDRDERYYSVDLEEDENLENNFLQIGKIQ